MSLIVKNYFSKLTTLFCDIIFLKLILLCVNIIVFVTCLLINWVVKLIFFYLISISNLGIFYIISIDDQFRFRGNKQMRKRIIVFDFYCFLFKQKTEKKPIKYHRMPWSIEKKSKHPKYWKYAGYPSSKNLKRTKKSWLPTRS